MVSLWPWKSGEDAASFEKTLSALTTKLSKTASTNESLKLRSRRVRVMWTLYAGFAYILAALLLTLVTGWRNWGATEYTVVAGGPVVIYTFRTGLTMFFDYRISNTEAYLKKLTKERDATIERLKESTKYNSTQQLLEKYGHSPKSKESRSHKKAPAAPKPDQPQGPRTGIAPPPTANIQRPVSQPLAAPSTPLQRPGSAASSVPGISISPAQYPPSPSGSIAPGAEFAPNAFSHPGLMRQYSASSAATFTQSHWYDRILDALLGEDETQPKNRLALICSECRLVNGQAPPGTRALEDFGRWRCGGCGAWNGQERPKEDAVADLVQGWEAERRAREKELGVASDAGIDSDNKDTDNEPSVVGGASDGSGFDLAPDSARDTPPPSRSTRSRSKNKGKR